MTQNGVDRSGAAGGTGASVTPLDENIIDAKGDLIVGTADDTAARKAVGANDTMLMADSVEATGVKWATPTQVGTALATGMSAKATAPIDSDRVLIGDSEASNTGKYTRVDSLLGATNDLTEDTTPDTDDFLLLYDVSASAAKKVKPENLPIAARKNYLINGAMNIWQRGITITAASSITNGDNNYVIDRWTLLSDGNDIVDVFRSDGIIPTGSLAGAVYSAALDVETANKKFGIIQFLESRDAKRLFGKGTATLSFKARKANANATVATMRAAVLAWSGAADAPTSDVVSAWNGSGTNPTLVANWTYENTPVDITLTNDFQQFSITGISLDTASTANLAVFLYYNNADGTVGDIIYITDVQLEYGSVATEYEVLPVAAEEALCERFYEKSYDMDTAPGTATVNGAERVVAARTASVDFHTSVFRVRKREQPSITLYSTGTGTAGQVRNESTAADTAGTSADIGQTRFRVGASITDTNVYGWHWTADAEL